MQVSDRSQEVLYPYCLLNQDVIHYHPNPAMGYIHPLMHCQCGARPRAIPVLAFQRNDHDQNDFLQPRRANRVLKIKMKTEAKINPTLIWDWNGTLLDDVDAAVAALSRMLAKHGLPPVTREFYRANFGFPVRPFYQQVGIDLDRVDWDEICTDFHAFIAAEPQGLHPTSLEALEAARAGGFNQCILSALREDLLQRDTARFGVAPFLTHIFGVDNLDGATKLSRGHDLVAAIPAQTKLYFIGDTLHDAEVGAAIGAEVILVDCGHQTTERLRATGRPVVPTPLAAVQYITKG